MLSLKNIVKDYGSGESSVHALKGVSINFRESELVAILGPSGCGKTTLLNIVGGLDRYTEGDLIINGKSTKEFNDRDWDTYRNHSVGFIFQSYNLIPHQSILKNVELALTLSGVKKEERRARALKALEEVGLKDQAKKRPNQLSGGQMQRVAIARAIVNNPDIILADEPTGALDSETSVQVLEILKKLSETRLVVMVTHNGELADEYATRIINLKDGLVINDTKPCTDDEIKSPAAKAENKKKASMGLLTAFSLSLNNLATKKGRTILTSLAGSIGIIGIALILSLSTGFNAYVQNIQRDTLSNYPITISRQNINTNALMANFMTSTVRNEEQYPNSDKITSQNVISDMVTNLAGMYESNDLTVFSQYLEKYTQENDTSNIISAIQYTYNETINIYGTDSAGQVRQLSPLETPSMDEVLNYELTPTQKETLNEYYKLFVNMLKSQDSFTEMIDNQKLIKDQYEVLSGKMPSNENEAIIVIDSYNQISDLNLYMLGLMNNNDIRWIFYKMMLSLFKNDSVTDDEIRNILNCDRSDIYYNGCKIDDLVGLTYKVSVIPEEYCRRTDSEGNPMIYPVDANGMPVDEPVAGGKVGNFWRKKTAAEKDAYLENEARSLKIVGVVRLKKGVSAGCLTGVVCYTPKLAETMRKEIVNSDIVKDYLDVIKIDNGTQYFDILSTTPSSPIISEDVYEKRGKTIGAFDSTTPSRISIYPKSFESKNDVIKIIDEFNAQANDKEKIKYTDYMGLMMSSITTIINAVTYVLIAFVSISLIVSSIMIGIITYISVLERTKEIGVLRSIGASKRDIARVFNAETFIIGAISGLMGIGITLLLNIPINIIIAALSGLTNVAVLPPLGAVILIAIAIVLTVIAGLIPSGLAAKKDPVIALRTE